LRAGLLLGVVLLAGCSLGGDDERRRDARTPVGSDAVAGPPASERILRFRACDGPFLPERGFLGTGWRRTLTRIGPVRLLKASRLSDPDVAPRRPYPLRVLFPPSRSVTIGVEGKASSRVGFLADGSRRWSGASADLYPALLIEDCPEPPPELGDLPAGRLYGSLLFVGVRRPACVPLLVTRNGGRTHRRVVSFGGAECPGSAPRACRPRLRRGALPEWARGGFSGRAPRAPHAVGRSREIAAIVFGDPLVSPPRKRRNNKILWVARRRADEPSDLLIRARRIEERRKVGRPVRRRVAGGPGPSIVDLPAAGCWRLTLSWSGRTDTLDVRYERRAAPAGANARG
jgi:hypothetical protein